MFAVGSAAACQRYPEQHQGDTGKHSHGDGLVKDEDAEDDRDHGQQIGHRRGHGRSLDGDDLVIQHVREPGPDDAQHSDCRDALGGDTWFWCASDC
jgi:hypothetical protein